MFKEDDENHGYGRVESGEAAAEKQGFKETMMPRPSALSIER
jgi:hypothetical protein